MKTVSSIVEEAEREVVEEARREAIEREKERIRARMNRKHWFPWRIRIINLNNQKED